MKKTILIPLMIFILALPAGCGTGKNDNAVARFKGGSLTREDLAAHQGLMKKSRTFRDKPDQLTPEFVFDHALNMEMIIAKGLDEKLHLDPQVRARIHEFMSGLFLDIMKTRLVPEINKEEFTEAELRQFYENHKDSYKNPADNGNPYSFEEREAYIRNDLLYARYREAWAKTYEGLRKEFKVEIHEKNLEAFSKNQEKKEPKS
jgi:hypothetical protein